MRTRQGRGGPVGRLVAALLIAAAAGVPASAHEIGTTRVVASVTPDGTYAIDVTTDAATLLARLALAARRPRSAPASTSDLQRGFDTLCAEVPRHLAIEFDGRVGTPHATCVVERTTGEPKDLAATGVTVTLAGPVPPHARAFRWRYDLTFASYALIVKSAAGAEATVWLEGGDTSQPLALARVEPPPSRSQVARTYVALGFTHILPEGLDHILFVLGIFLLSRRVKPLLWQVSAFTLAHTITLGLTLYGVVSLPSSVVEPMIALSIVYVAVENVVTPRLQPWRVALVFGFGLLHGMGFAGVLRELTLPRSEFLTGLVAFNAGVEAGQLTIILTASVVLFGLARNTTRYRRLVVVPGSIAIAATGLFWTVQRLPL